jgi:hypothetical protein
LRSSVRCSARVIASGDGLILLVLRRRVSATCNAGKRSRSAGAQFMLGSSGMKLVSDGSEPRHGRVRPTRR